MDKTAIDLIQQTAIDAQGERLPSNLHGRATALPSDYGIHDLERFNESRFRFRGSLLTQSIADFVQYVKAKGDGECEGFIDADNLSAKMFFNLGTDLEPGHADWTATLKLKATAAFKALLGIDGKTLNQRQLIDWLEDWAPFITAIPKEGEGSVPLTTAIAAIRKVTIKATSESESTQDDFKASRSKFDEIEAKSTLGLPAGFNFDSEPYLGLPPRTFRLRLSVLTDADRPLLVLRIVQREGQEEAIAHDFKSVLFRELEGAATLTIGTFTP